MEALVNINGPIVDQVVIDETTGQPKEWPVTTLDMIQSQLEWQKPFDAVRVVINSPGGDVYAGLGIYDMLRAMPVPVTTEALGQCSSIATIIFLAGQTRRLNPNTNFMIHQPWGGVQGPLKTLQDYAQEVADLQAKMLVIYTSRTGTDEAVLLPMLLAETTMPAEQVRALGFATEIVQPVLAMARLHSLPTTQAGATPAPTTQMPTAPRTVQVAGPAPGTVPNPQPAGTAPQPVGTAAPVVVAPGQPAPAPAPTHAPGFIPAPAQTQAHANPVATAMAGLRKSPAARAYYKMLALFTRGNVKALATTTTDGDALTIDTGDGDTIANGQAVFDANGAPAADGTYNLEDGTVITVAGGVITGVTAPSTAQAAPTTLEEANAIIAQLRAGTAAPAAAAPAAPTAAAQPTPVPAPAAPLVQVAPTALAGNPNQAQLNALMATFGASVATGGGVPQAADVTHNPSLAHRGPITASPVADANSKAAKDAAADNIRERQRNKYRRPGGN